MGLAARLNAEVRSAGPSGAALSGAIGAAGGAGAAIAGFAERPRRSEQPRVAQPPRAINVDTAGASVEQVAVVEDVPWPDESAEAAFLSEAKERGETVPVKRPEEESEAEGAKPMPPLESLVERIPQAARDALEDLFRAKFVRVQRVPKKVLKK